ncbi:MAG: DUF1016 family protein [Saprospiraceae bacterium]|nr:DUF1016 family protein [Saprospiraceae bacterium]
MHFETLHQLLHQTHLLLRQRVAGMLSQSLLIRNWLIGHHLVEFEQKGLDYAQYGDRLLPRLAGELAKSGLPGMPHATLVLCRNFYLTHPQLAPEIAKFPEILAEEHQKAQQFQILSESADAWTLPADVLCSVFFGETNLKNTLLNRLQQFLLSLDNGFCFEARQKSFLTGTRHYKIDLLFYHRLLKCPVLIVLRTHRFKPEDAVRMNYHLRAHRENGLAEGDNPPVGIILCTWQDEAVVRYATGAVKELSLVRRYMALLPAERVLRDFLLEAKGLE